MNKKTISYKECPGVLMERFITLSLNIKVKESEYDDFDIAQYTLDELIILFELSSEQGLCQNEIAQKIHKNKSTVKRTIDKLEKKGAIVKRVDKNDSRRQNIYLGDVEKELKDNIANCYEREKNWFMECLGEQEYHTFMENLNSLYVNALKRYNA